MLQIKAGDLKEHVAELARTLASVCDLTPSRPLVISPSRQDTSQVVVHVVASGAVPTNATTIVTSDLGRQEQVVALRMGSSTERYWLGLHELWIPRGRRKLEFELCGLRLYTGDSGEDAVQILRLEWVAPKVHIDGTVQFDGEHAGHPHWHIDSAALVGSEDYLRSLNLLTAPSSTTPTVETFEPDLAQPESPGARVYDCSWLPKVHLAAHANWMNAHWDGETIPGPHQTEPLKLIMLTTWLKGALRYLASEVQAHGV